MADMPTIDTNKLGSGLWDLAKRFIASSVQGTFSTLTSIADGAKSLGIEGLGGISDALKGFVDQILQTCGITSPAAPETPAPAAKPPAPASGNHDVTPPKTPAAPKPPRSR